MVMGGKRKNWNENSLRAGKPSCPDQGQWNLSIWSFLPLISNHQIKIQNCCLFVYCLSPYLVIHLSFCECDTKFWPYFNLEHISRHALKLILSIHIVRDTIFSN